MRGDGELSRSIDGVLVEPSGALLVALVATDQESFWTSLTPVPDIAAPALNEPSEELYTASAWLTSLDRREDGALFACDADGHVHTDASGAWAVEPVCPGRALRVVRVLPDGTVLTAGTAGVVYRRTERGWVADSEPLGNWITDIAGRSATDAVLCGDAGLLATRDASGWRVHLQSGAGTLNCALALPDWYLVGGERGTLLHGAGSTWTRRPADELDVRGLALHGDEVWAACGAQGAATMDADGTLRIVRATFGPSCIHAAGNFVAFGAGVTLVRTDGSDWKGRRYG